jgi:hypothetical protein
MYSVRRTKLSILKPEFFQERGFRANSSASSSYSTSSQISRRQNTSVIWSSPESGT